MKLLLISILTTFGLVSCASKRLISHPEPGTAGIVIETEQTAEHKWGKVTFPPGLYLPEAKDESGVYYAAPNRVRTGSITKGGTEHGGLYVAHGTGYQYLWIGQPAYQLQQAPSTIMGQWGVETPLRYVLKERIKISPASRR
jgi:hypothetical protein